MSLPAILKKAFVSLLASDILESIKQWRRGLLEQCALSDKTRPRYGATPKNPSPSVGVVPGNLETTPTTEAAFNRRGGGGGEEEQKVVVEGMVEVD